MIKKTITYVDYNGKERSDDFYFNLSKAELLKLEYSKRGGFAAWAQSIIDARSENELWAMFEDIIAKSYGVKSSDGRQFHKSEEITKQFIESEAYSVFLMELIHDEKAAADFTNGLINGAVAHPDKPVLSVM